MYTDILQVRGAIESFGLKFVVGRTGKDKADCVYWSDRDAILNYCKRHNIPAPSVDIWDFDGLLAFRERELPIAFSNKIPGRQHRRITKQSLKAFLFNLEDCGICMDTALIESVSCAQCGFIICRVCNMKLYLQKLRPDELPMISCPKCRYERKENIFSLFAQMSQSGEEMDKFNDIERKKLIYVERRASEMFRSCSAESDDSNRILQMWQATVNEQKQIRKKQKEDLRSRLDQMDQSKCASCKTKFVDKRSNCSGCMKVSYCDKKCQTEHWKEHKKDCKLFKMFVNDDQ